jgi:ATP-dependent helicase/nuclease subunit B
MLLRYFHEALRELATPTAHERLQLLDAAAARATGEMGLTAAEFLPFAASWPRIRVAYLDWLQVHEAAGVRFERAEAPLQVRLGALTLVGRIDRVDRRPDGARLVIDYKTESRSKTAERLKRPQEDTQLAFYAALLEDDVPGACYLSVVEGDAVKVFDQPDIVHWRDQLVDAIRDDMGRIAGGHVLPALGAGSACEFCAARGLCRRDFWSPEAPGAGEARHG